LLQELSTAAVEAKLSTSETEAFFSRVVTSPQSKAIARGILVSVIGGLNPYAVGAGVFVAVAAWPSSMGDAAYIPSSADSQEGKRYQFDPNLNLNGLEVLSTAAATFDRAGLTKAGRSLAKHGGRPGSAFPCPTGRPDQVNQQAQDIVDDILTNPASTFTPDVSGRFGPILDVVDPNGRGVRFSATGDFIHFLEPPR
jgi:hypothetical protein